MVTTTEFVYMSKMRTTIAITTSTGITMVTELIGVGPMFPVKIGKFLQGTVKVVWLELRICCRR